MLGTVLIRADYSVSDFGFKFSNSIELGYMLLCCTYNTGSLSQFFFWLNNYNRIVCVS